MSLRTWIPVALLLLTSSPTAAREWTARQLAPDRVEGRLWAAECVGTAGADSRCTLAALRAGKPGGILTEHGFTLLLVDGRVLLRTCVDEKREPVRLRASGVLHASGFAMTVFRLEQDCGAGFSTVDLPHSGVAGDGAIGGDE